MGRPKKYTTEFIEVEAKALLEYAKESENTIPFKQEFAIKRCYPSENLSIWAKENDEFSQALKRFEDVQTLNIVKAIMKKKIDVAAGIFTLKNVAGWRDKKELEHTGEITVNFAEKIQSGRKRVLDALEPSNN